MVTEYLLQHTEYAWSRWRKLQAQRKQSNNMEAGTLHSTHERERRTVEIDSRSTRRTSRSTQRSTAAVSVSTPSLRSTSRKSSSSGTADAGARIRRSVAHIPSKNDTTRMWSKPRSTSYAKDIDNDTLLEETLCATEVPYKSGNSLHPHVSILNNARQRCSVVLSG